MSFSKIFKNRIGWKNEKYYKTTYQTKSKIPRYLLKAGFEVGKMYADHDPILKE